MKHIIKILALTLAVVLVLAGCATPQKEAGYTLPPEWADHEGTWLIWPHDYGLIEPEYVAMIADLWVTMTQALHTGERVHIVAYSAQEQSRITALLEDAQVDMAQVDFFLAETDQFWARDYGPIFAADAQGQPAILDFGFNGYARMDKLGPDVPEEYRWEMPEFCREDYLENFRKDDLLSSALAGALGLPLADCNSFVLEAGAIEHDGKGTLITTESCILNENRNPGLTREAAEAYFQTWFGITNVIWLEGSPDEDITDGHIDGLLRFVDETTILTMTEEDYLETYDYTPAGDYAKILGAKNAQGQAYDIVTLPITAQEVEWLGWRANYLNYYAGNRAVLVPVYGDVMDQEALDILAELYPGKEIVPIDGQILAALGGGVHCVTQQQPAFPLT